MKTPPRIQPPESVAIRLFAMVVYGIGLFAGVVWLWHREAVLGVVVLLSVGFAVMVVLFAGPDRPARWLTLPLRIVVRVLRPVLGVMRLWS